MAPNAVPSGISSGYGAECRYNQRPSPQYEEWHLQLAMPVCCAG